jgi:hypothetical protein
MRVTYACVDFLGVVGISQDLGYCSRLYPSHACICGNLVRRWLRGCSGSHFRERRIGLQMACQTVNRREAADRPRDGQQVLYNSERQRRKAAASGR